MPKLADYHLPIEIRSYDADAWGELPDSQLLRILEHAAWAASAAGGFGIPWYEEHGTAWVVRRMTLARLVPIRFGDEVAGRTWISSIRRVRSDRDYELRLLPGGQVAVAARGDWVYVDRRAQRPIAIDPEIVARVELRDPVPNLDALPTTLPAGIPRNFSAQRRAGRSEADSMNHVNNAVYVNWLDEALADACAEAGAPLADPGRPGPRLISTHLLLDYLQSARPGDQVTINTRLLGTTPDPAVFAWDQQILRADGEQLLRCTSQRRLLAADPAALLPALLE